MPGKCDANYKFDPQRGYDFTPYATDMSGISLYYGLGAHDTSGDSNIKIKFTVEHPNLLLSSLPSIDVDIASEINRYDMIYTLCPYTAAYINEKYNTNKCVSTWFPLPDEPVYVNKERQYDVFYSGHHIPQVEITSIIYNSIQKHMGQTFSELNSKIAVPSYYGYKIKMEIYAKTKICVVHNLLYANLPNKELVADDEIFKKHLPWITDGSAVCPQIKSRMFEGAKMGCILLAYKDPFGTIERFFNEDTEFVYFTDAADLDAKIADIVKNYDDYKHIGLAAQKRYNENYTLRHFVQALRQSI